MHLYTTGKVMQNNQPLPMYTLLNLNEDCQGISVSNEYKDLKIEKVVTAGGEVIARVKALKPGRYLLVNEYKEETVKAYVVAE